MNPSEFDVPIEVADENLKDFVRIKLRALSGIAKELSALPYKCLSFLRTPFNSVKDNLTQIEAKEVDSYHECGHLFISMLNKNIIVEAQISRFSSRIQTLLGLNDGHISDEKTHSFDNSTLGSNLQNLFRRRNKIDHSSVKSVVKEILLYLGGPISEHILSHPDSPKDNATNALKHNASANPQHDLNQVKKKIGHITKKLGMEAVDEEEFVQIFRIFFDELQEFMDSPKVKNCISIMSHHLEKKGQIYSPASMGGVNTIMFEELKEKGVTDADLESITNEYEAMIDILCRKINYFLSH